MKQANSRTPLFRSRPRFITAVVIACVVFVIGAITVWSRGRSESSAKSPVVQPAKTNANLPDHQIHLAAADGEAQELTSREAQERGAGLRDLVNQSTEGLVEVKHADGSVSLDQQGRFQSVTVARINKDGSITQSCVDNPQAAAAFFGIDPKLIDENLESSSKPNNLKPAATRN